MTEVTKREPRVLRMIKPAGDSPTGLPVDQQTELNAREIATYRAMAQQHMAALCLVGEVSESTQVITVKMADLITRGIEGQMLSLKEYGENVKAELAIAYRNYEEGEIDDSNIQRLERRLKMLREQFQVWRDLFEASRANGEKMRVGLNFPYPSYRSIRQIAEVKRSVRQMRESRREAERLIGMSEPEYRRYKDKLHHTHHWSDGVETDDGYGTGAADVEEIRREQQARLEHRKALAEREARNEEYRRAGLVDPNRDRRGALNAALGPDTIPETDVGLPWD